MNRYYWEREYQTVAGHNSESIVGLAPMIFDRESPTGGPIAHATSVAAAEKIVDALNARERAK